MYDYILFDMDDTIFDFQRAQLLSFKGVLSKFNILYSLEYYNLYREINHELWQQFDNKKVSKDFVQTERFNHFFRAIGMNLDGNYANRVYQDLLSFQSWLMPYSKEVCAKLAEEHTLLIVTNGVGKTQKKRLFSSAVAPYFTNILVSEDVGVAKPDKNFFDVAFKMMKCNDASRMLLVGDSLSSDINGANNAGIDSCWLNPAGNSIERDINITYAINDLRQLLDIV